MSDTTYAILCILLMVSIDEMADRPTMTTIAPDYNRLSERFKLLSHPERLRILDAVRHEPECVCHLSALLEKPQPYVSQQLRVLREAGFILDENDGVNVYYRLSDAEIASWLDVALGPVLVDASGVQHQRIVGCPCPKCAEAVDVTLDELMTTA